MGLNLELDSTIQTKEDILIETDIGVYNYTI